MSNPYVRHFTNWFQVGQKTTQKLIDNLDHFDQTEKLKLIRLHYDRVSQVRKVCNGKAFFVGVPRPQRYDEEL